MSWNPPTTTSTTCQEYFQKHKKSTRRSAHFSNFSNISFSFILLYILGLHFVTMNQFQQELDRLRTKRKRLLDANRELQASDDALGLTQDELFALQDEHDTLKKAEANARRGAHVSTHATGRYRYRCDVADRAFPVYNGIIIAWMNSPGGTPNRVNGLRLLETSWVNYTRTGRVRGEKQTAIFEQVCRHLDPFFGGLTDGEKTVIRANEF